MALTVTRSGTTRRSLEFIERAPGEGALTVAITGMRRLADRRGWREVVFDTGTPNGATWTEFFAGRASDVLTAGLLFVLVAQRVPDHLTANHPNGPGQPVDIRARNRT